MGEFGDEGLRVAVVSKDALARAGLCALVSSELAAQVTESVASPRHLRESSDLVLLDEGHSTSETVNDLQLDAPVLILVDDLEGARRALAQGASGVLLRDGEPERLRAASHALIAGLAVIDDAFSSELLAETHPQSVTELEEPLTPREHEVLLLLADGGSNRDVAHKLNISERTVKFHVAALAAKLEAQGRLEIVTRALKLGLLTL